MEKLEHIEKTTVDIIHHFYCDDCGVFLGSTQEYSDGWYGKLGDFELKFCLPPIGWYEVHKCFCDECKEKFVTQVHDELMKLGFSKR